MFENAEAFLPLEGRPPGVVLVVPEALPAADVVAVLRACAAASAEWTPVLVEQEEGELVAIPFAPGYPSALEELTGFCRTGKGEVFLRLDEVLARVRVVRHDVNNRLTAGLAETQLLLMDAAPGETRDGLESVQEQLRRIAEVVATLRFPVPQQVAGRRGPGAPGDPRGPREPAGPQRPAEPTEPTS